MELAMKAHRQLPGGLPSEIWLYMMEILDHADHSSLKSVVLCSSDMYKLAAPILFRTLYLEYEYEGSSTEWKWQERLYPTHLCVHVKTIIVVRPRGPGGRYLTFRFDWAHLDRAFTDRLYHLLKMAENLQDFCWWYEKYMPGEVLYQLYRYRPQARVHIASSKAALCERINQSKHTSAPHLSCIRSIEAEWYAAEYDEPIKPNSAANYPIQLKTIICRCQRLESLALISEGSYRRRNFVSDLPLDFERKEMEASMNDRAPITLEKGDIFPQIENLHLRGTRLGPIQSELWATQLQWQYIKRLSLISVNWTHLLPKLTKERCFQDLEALEMSPPILSSRYRNTSAECINQFHAFLAMLPPLKLFIGHGFPQETLAVLATYHSTSLTDLRFRDELRSYAGAKNSSRGNSSIFALGYLFTQFPKIHSLGLQAEWTPEGELPSDLLANIVLQPSIRHLELNLPHLDRHSYSESWPYPSTNTCESLSSISR